MVTAARPDSLSPGMRSEPFSSPTHTFLHNLLGDRGIEQAIASLRSDRFTGQESLKDFLVNAIQCPPEMDEAFIQKDPLLAMLALILRNDPKEDPLRDLAASTYISQHPEDKRFEKCYADVTTPNILFLHLLIDAGLVCPSDPGVKDFYDGQMYGIWKGSIAFDKGDRLSEAELALVQKREGPSPKYPISAGLIKKEGYYEAIEWCSTPVMSGTLSRVDAIFAASRRTVQKEVVEGLIQKLEETSRVVQRMMVVAVIGPYGTGKKEFVKHTFSTTPVTIFSAESLKNALQNGSSRGQDTHFEAVMLEDEMKEKINAVPVLVTTRAAVDPYNFTRLTGRDFPSRVVILHEIAPRTVEQAIDQFVKREGPQILQDPTRMGAARASAENALANRRARIEEAQKRKLDYTLYLSDSQDGVPTFPIIAMVKNGELMIAKGREELYGSLVPPKPKTES